MKPVYKCDYCNFIDTKEKVKEHEKQCFKNYDRKSCCTCIHSSFKIDIRDNKIFTVYKCKTGIDIPEGKIYEFCSKYERKKDILLFSSDNPFK